jgi:aminoglycoside N3'-acetyltransferase
MHLKNKLESYIDSFIKKKLRDKGIKLKIKDNLDLFFYEVFDSLDFAEFNNFMENLGFKLDISKNDYRIPRTKTELLKVFNKKNESKKSSNLSSKNIFFETLKIKLKKKLRKKRIQNLIIHSNFTQLLNLDISAKEFLNFLFENFPNLTIFAPGGYSHEEKISSTKKKIPNNEFGILSKELLTLGKTFRNTNPFDNLIGFNKKQKYFTSNNTIAYGNNSPYRKLLKSNTYIMLLDVNFYYNSMFHMAEFDAKVPYRKFINFKKNKKTYTLFARNKISLKLDYAKFGRIKEIKNISSIFSIRNIRIILSEYKSLYDYSLKILKNNPYFLNK